MREKREALMKDRNKIIEILNNGGIKAKKVAESKLNKIKQAIGVSLE